MSTKKGRLNLLATANDVTAAAADIVIILHFSMHVQVDWAHSIASANIK